MKHKGTLLAVAITFLLLPSASSLGCSYLSDEDKGLCENIDNLETSEREKEILLNSIIYQDKTLPDHDFVKDWNSKVSMSEAPEEVSTKDKGVIRNAWVKIVSVMPSVLEENILYVDSEGEIKTEFNYDIVLPTETISGDCRTEYSLENQRALLHNNINEEFIGNMKLNPFHNSNGDKRFLAILDIESEVKIDHYEENKYCTKRYRGSKKCRRYKTECEYSHSDIDKDRLVLTDSLIAKQNKNLPGYYFEILNSYLDSTKGEIESFNFSTLLLKFRNSEYKETNYIYDYVYSIKPYNILTIRANPLHQESSRNINIRNMKDGFEFIVRDKRDCQISLFNHFSRKDFLCLPLFDSNEIKIKTDNIHYYTNESILVEIFPKGLEIDLEYANQTFKVKDSIVLEADPKYSRIKASYNGETFEKAISITEKDNLVLASKILLFFFINYSIFSFLTKEAWILKWLNVAS